jgi:serine/threonine protein phosphatase PrpC
VNRIDVVALTHRGLRRENNEDTVAVAGFLSGVLEGEPTRITVSTARPVTCLVADGLGGHAEGGRASRLAAAVIADAGPRLHDEPAVVKAIGDADAAIRAEAAGSPAWAGMGTTLVVLTVNDGSALCANVGDSRCYLHRDGMLVQLSADDSPPPMPGSTVARTTFVTQTLGGSATGTASPHVTSVPVGPGDRFLLCSDGLTDFVPEDRLESVLDDADDDLESMRTLLRDALDAGGEDNVSALLVTILE